jgi:predicted SprT family Zn-dependent metalloprotease
MSKETKTQFKDRVIRIATELFEYMELGNYRLNIKFRNDLEDWQAMTIIPDHVYLEAHLKVNLNIIKDNFIDEHLEWLICHELCHIHTHYIYTLAEKAINKTEEETLRIVHENMTEKFARLIMKGRGVKINGIKTDYK